jgi:hypothetical protein
MRGMGAQLSTDYCASGWSLLDPRAWLGGCAAADVADIYQKVQYGTAPPPVVPPPAPTVSLTSNANTPGAVFAGTAADGTPVYAVPQTAAESQAAIVANQNAAIDAAIAAGYNPYGNLPVNALDLDNFWKKYGTLVLVAGAALGGVVLLNSLGGRR